MLSTVHSALLCLFIISVTMAANDHPMPGGFTKQDVDSDTIKEFAQKGLTKFNQQSNDAHQHIVTKILSAESQVVAGARYRIIVEFGRTNCKKDVVCGENEPVVSTQKYLLDVFSQPWTRTEEITFEPYNE